jgi:hypothetical protein
MKKFFEKSVAFCVGICAVIFWFGVLDAVVLAVVREQPEQVENQFFALLLAGIVGVFVWCWQLWTVWANLQVRTLTLEALLFFALFFLLGSWGELGGVEDNICGILAASSFFVSVYWLYQLGKDCWKKAMATAVGNTYESFLPAKAEEVFMWRRNQIAKVKNAFGKLKWFC